MFTQERPRTSEEHFQKCSCVPDRIAIWWCCFLKRGESRSPRGKTSNLLEPEREPTTRSCTCTVNDTSACWLDTVTKMLILSRNFDLFWLTIAASHTTVRHNTYALPPLHSKLFLQLLSILVLLATFTTGRGGSTNTRSWYRLSIIFELVEALTQLTFLASKTGASNMWKNNIFPSRNVWEPENLFSLLRCLQLFGQPTFAVIDRCYVAYIDYPNDHMKHSSARWYPLFSEGLLKWRLTNVTLKRQQGECHPPLKVEKDFKFYLPD